MSHLYHFRGSTGYQNQRRYFEKTKSKQVAIGPNAAGKTGYIKVDTVHPGDQDGKKGVYGESLFFRKLILGIPA